MKLKKTKGIQSIKIGNQPKVDKSKLRTMITDNIKQNKKPTKIKKELSGKNNKNNTKNNSTKIKNEKGRPKGKTKTAFKSPTNPKGLNNLKIKTESSIDKDSGLPQRIIDKIGNTSQNINFAETSNDSLEPNEIKFYNKALNSLLQNSANANNSPENSTEKNSNRVPLIKENDEILINNYVDDLNDFESSKTHIIIDQHIKDEKIKNLGFSSDNGNINENITRSKIDDKVVFNSENKKINQEEDPINKNLRFLEGELIKLDPHNRNLSQPEKEYLKQIVKELSYIKKNAIKLLEPSIESKKYKNSGQKK